MYIYGITIIALYNYHTAMHSHRFACIDAYAYMHGYTRLMFMYVITVLECTDDLTALYIELKRYDLALPYLEEALIIRKDMLGNFDPTTLICELVCSMLYVV